MAFMFEDMPTESMASPVPQYAVLPGRKAKLKKPGMPGAMESTGIPGAMPSVRPEHARATNVRGQQGIPDIYQAFGLEEKRGLLGNLEEGAKGFLRTFIPSALGGAQYGLPEFARIFAEQGEEAAKKQSLREKIARDPQMVQAYEAARGMFPEGGPSFQETLQSEYGKQMAAKSAQDLYGGGFTGIMANPYVPEDIKERVLSSEMAVRSIPTVSYQLGEPTLSQAALSYFTGKPIQPKVSVTARGGEVPPPIVESPLEPLKTKKTSTKTKKPTDFWGR